MTGMLATMSTPYLTLGDALLFRDSKGIFCHRGLAFNKDVAQYQLQGVERLVADVEHGLKIAVPVVHDVKKNHDREDGF